MPRAAGSTAVAAPWRSRPGRPPRRTPCASTRRTGPGSCGSTTATRGVRCGSTSAARREKDDGNRREIAGKRAKEQLKSSSKVDLRARKERVRMQVARLVLLWITRHLWGRKQRISPIAWQLWSQKMKRLALEVKSCFRGCPYIFHVFFHVSLYFSYLFLFCCGVSCLLYPLLSVYKPMKMLRWLPWSACIQERLSKVLEMLHSEKMVRALASKARFWLETCRIYHLEHESDCLTAFLLRAELCFFSFISYLLL